MSKGIKICYLFKKFTLHTCNNMTKTIMFTFQEQNVTVNKMLSYRRETALQGALQFSPKVEHWNWETIFYRHYRSIFNHCDIIGLKICQFGEKNAKYRLLRCSRSFKVIEVGTSDRTVHPPLFRRVPIVSVKKFPGLSRTPEAFFQDPVICQ